MATVGWDTETAKITRERPNPEPVCLTWWTEEGGKQITRNWKDQYRALLESGDTLIAYNQAFDLKTICKNAPEFFDDTFIALREGRLKCSFVTELLIRIRTGELKFIYKPSADKVVHARHSMEWVVERYFNKQVAKGSDTWRLRYGELENTPLEQWPQAAIDYALDDSIYPVRIDEIQEKTYGPIFDQRPQYEAAFALALMTSEGMYTDGDWSQRWIKWVKEQAKECIEIGFELGFMKMAPISKKTGKPTTKSGYNTKRKLLGELLLKAYGEKEIPRYFKGERKGEVDLQQAYKGVQPIWDMGNEHPPTEEDIPKLVEIWGNIKVPRTDKGAVSTKAETIERCGDPKLLKYAKGLKYMKDLQQFVPTLDNPLKLPHYPSYQVLVNTGRTSCFKPNIQQSTKTPGFREAWIPKEGYVFVFADYSFIEMVCLAEICIRWFGYCPLGDAINKGEDPHIHLAADMLDITYKEAMDRFKKGDKELKFYRQKAKGPNFGLPGLMGARGLATYCAGFGVTISEYEAEHLIQIWTKKWDKGLYIQKISRLVSSTGQVVIDQIETGRQRAVGKVTAAGNTFFQGLAADGAKRAMVQFMHRCYGGEKTMRTLYNEPKDEILSQCIPCAFIHDEFGFYVPEAIVEEAKERIEQVMIDGMSEVIHHVKVSVESVAMRRWSKGAYNDDKVRIWDTTWEEVMP